MYSLIQEGKSNLRLIFFTAVAAALAMAAIILENNRLENETMAVSDGAAAPPSRHAAKNSTSTAPSVRDLPEYRNESWQEYKNDILGISFQYPAEWGRPQTVPYLYLTNLKAISDSDNLSDANIYHNSIAIEFIDPVSFEQNGPVVNFYNDRYQGRLFPNAFATRLGPMDNFTEVVKSGNICDYRIAFDKKPAYQGLAEELSAECAFGVKTYFYRIAQASRQDMADWNDYFLSQSAFFKLENGYYDNVSVGQTIWSGQSKNSKLLLENIIAGGDNYDLKKPLDREAYLKKMEDFAGFVKSVRKFKPIAAKDPILNVLPGESSDIATIKKYYYAISMGNMKNAYEMYNDAKIDFKEYEKWYGSVLAANPVDFEDLGGGKYQFYVRYQDKNSEPETYRVVMQVKNNKLYPVSSEKIADNKTKFGEMSAYTSERLGKSYLMLATKSQESVLDQGAGDIMSGTVISDGRLEFSPKGSYLAAQIFGWEWFGANVYDIKSGKIAETLSMPSGYGFTPDEKYFYACAAAPFSGDFYAIVEDVPEFKIKKSIFDQEETGFYGIRCRYDDKSQAIIFTLTDLYDRKTMEPIPGEKTAKFLIGAGEVVESEVVP